jgi:hypothetical protein
MERRSLKLTICKEMLTTACIKQAIDRSRTSNGITNITFKGVSHCFADGEGMGVE